MLSIGTETKNIMIQIEKNIPLPEGLKQKNTSYPFADMQVGDSFLAPFKTKGGAYSTAHSWKNRHHPEWKFLVSPEDGGFRIFRVK